jgi:hypothetical protein
VPKKEQESPAVRSSSQGPQGLGLPAGSRKQSRMHQAATKLLATELVAAATESEVVPRNVL